MLSHQATVWDQVDTQGATPGSAHRLCSGYAQSLVCADGDVLGQL